LHATPLGLPAREDRAQNRQGQFGGHGHDDGRGQLLARGGGGEVEAGVGDEQHRRGGRGGAVIGVAAQQPGSGGEERGGLQSVEGDPGDGLGGRQGGGEVAEPGQQDETRTGEHAAGTGRVLVGGKGDEGHDGGLFRSHEPGGRARDQPCDPGGRESVALLSVLGVAPGTPSTVVA
jgi:hypothetical protein